MIGQPTMTPDEEAEWVRLALAGELSNVWPPCPHGAVWKRCKPCRREYKRKWIAARDAARVREAEKAGAIVEL